MITFVASLAVFVGLVILAMAAVRLHGDVADAEQRLRVVTGGYSQAGLLAGARKRFRDRQRLIEEVVDTSTAGIETAHRTIARVMGHREGRGAEFYSSVRDANRGIGRALSGLFAPETAPRDSESLEDWRARQDDDDESGS